MSGIADVLPDLEPHTKAKHDILRRYLQAWFPIMALVQGSERIVYLDGFAGSGEYSQQEEGSPLIALRAALENDRWQIASSPREFLFLFIELIPEKVEHLRQVVASRFKLPSNVSVVHKCGRFDQCATTFLDEADRHAPPFPAIFGFIDPCGFSHTPFSVIKRLMGHRKCEVFINLMYEEISRFLSDPRHERTFDELFATREWRQGRKLRSGSRERFITGLYERQLRQVAGAAHIRSFKMLNVGNRTDYFLFFATKNPTGLRKMDEAMHKVDQRYGRVFSDRDNPNQLNLWGPQSDYAELRDLILHHYGGQEVPVDVIDQYVREHTSLHPSCIRPVLRQLEQDRLEGSIGLEVVSSPSKRRRRGTFPPGTVVRISPSRS